MYVVLVVLVVVVALILIGVVLAQESKGGLSSRFDDYKNSFGIHRSMSFVEKTTWSLAGIIVVMCIILAYVL